MPKDNSLHKLKGMHGVKSDTWSRKGNHERQFDVKLKFYTMIFCRASFGLFDVWPTVAAPSKSIKLLNYFPALNLSWKNSEEFTRKQFVDWRPSKSTLNVLAMTSNGFVEKLETWRRWRRRWRKKTRFWSDVGRRRRPTKRVDENILWSKRSSSKETGSSRRRSSSE